MLEVQTTRISRTHVPSMAKSKAQFRIPKSNSYFERIKQGILAIGTFSDSVRSDTTQQEHKQSDLLATQAILSHDTSMKLAKKVSLLNKEANNFHQTQSLPKISKKTSKIVANEIIKSQLGCFNYFQILRKKEKQLQQRLAVRHLTRVSSFVSDEEMHLDDQASIKLEEPEVKYEDYDNLLMSEPLIYRRRYFKLKHKADWSISK